MSKSELKRVATQLDLFESAPSGYVYICMGCGKLSKDKGGWYKIDPGWDESCMLNCVLVYEESVVEPQGGWPDYTPKGET